MGQCLARIWYTLTESQIDSIIAQICDFDGQLLQTNFPAIGSLQKQDSEFIVGRAGLSCIAPYRFRKDVGPWQSSVAFIDAHIKAAAEEEREGGGISSTQEKKMSRAAKLAKRMAKKKTRAAARWGR